MPKVPVLPAPVLLGHLFPVQSHPVLSWSTVPASDTSFEIAAAYHSPSAKPVPHPKTIIKPIKPPLHIIDDKKEKRKIEGKLTRNETLKLISEIEKSMKKASQELDFEKAAELRDEMLELKATLL